MPFNPKELPVSVQSAFNIGPIAWPLVLERSLMSGIRDITKLTDIIFYLHHPERIGNPLKPHETKLIDQWKGFRTLVRQRAPRYVSPFISNLIEGTDVPGF